MMTAAAQYGAGAVLTLPSRCASTLSASLARWRSPAHIEPCGNKFNNVQSSACDLRCRLGSCQTFYIVHQKIRVIMRSVVPLPQNLTHICCKRLALVSIVTAVRSSQSEPFEPRNSCQNSPIRCVVSVLSCCGFSQDDKRKAGTHKTMSMISQHTTQASVKTSKNIEGP